MVRLFVLLSKGLDSYEANEKDGLEGGAWGAVLAQGFGGGAVSVLRLASGGTPDGDEYAGFDKKEDDDDVRNETGAKVDGVEEGTHDAGNENGVQDVSMEDVKQNAGEASPRADAGGKDKISGAPTPDTATSQSGKQGTRSKAAKEREGARIICWEYPAPLP